jgi:Domain of unknown function (DUF4476)
MRPINRITAFFLMVALTTTAIFAQNNPYGDTNHNDKAQGHNNRKRQHKHCTEAYSNKLFNRDYAGLANSNAFHLDKELRSYIKFRCVTSEQVRRLALLYPTDREKYEFLTYSLNYAFDIENFAMTGSVLANRNARDGFYRFLVQQGIPAGDYFNTNTYYANNGGYYPPPVYAQAPPPQQPTYDNSYNNYPDPRLNNQNQTPQYQNQNQGQNPQYNNPNQTPQYQNQNNPNSQYNNNQPVVNSKSVNSGYQGLMTYKEFAIMKEQIKQNTIETGRLETAKKLTKDNVLTAIQVAEIARLFNFDNNRLDFAKFAFDYTHNRDDYNVVGDVFVFQKNKEDLQRYIQTKK